MKKKKSPFSGYWKTCFNFKEKFHLANINPSTSLEGGILSNLMNKSLLFDIVLFNNARHIFFLHSCYSIYKA